MEPGQRRLSADEIREIIDRGNKQPFLSGSDSLGDTTVPAKVPPYLAQAGYDAVEAPPGMQLMEPNDDNRRRYYVTEGVMSPNGGWASILLDLLPPGRLRHWLRDRLNAY